MQTLRNTILVLGLLFVGVLVQGYVWHWWFETFVINRIHLIYGGVHVDVLVEQIPTMVTFLLLGTAGFFVFESPWPPLWAAILGVSGSLFNAAMTQSAFTGMAEVGD